MYRLLVWSLVKTVVQGKLNAASSLECVGDLTVTAAAAAIATNEVLGVGGGRRMVLLLISSSDAIGGRTDACGVVFPAALRWYIHIALVVDGDTNEGNPKGPGLILRV